MDLDASIGEKTDFMIKIRSFSGIGAGGAGTEQLISFSIDKRKPMAPEIEGVIDGEHYQEDLVITFPESDLDTYYALQKGRREDNQDFPEFKRFEKPHIIESREGTFDTYRIFAYRKDAAGNQSEIREWEFYIDREIIYISENGDDLNAGTRSRPFKTLEKAVDYSEVTGRNTVFLAGGTYTVNDSIVIPEELNLYGGFNEDDWESSHGINTVIKTGEFFPEERPLFLIAGRGVFKDLTISIDGNPTSAVIQQEGGDWRIEKSEIVMKNSSIESSVIISDGRLIIDDAAMLGDGFEGGVLLDQRGGEVEIRNSKFMRTDSGAESLLISVKNHGETRISGTLLSPGDARSTTALNVQEGKVRIEGQSEVMPGRGSVDAIGIQGRSSELTILNSTIESQEAGRVVQGIFCQNCELIVQDSFLDLEAKVGAVGLQAKDSRYLLIGNTMIAKASDFIFIFRGNDSSGRGINNFIRAEETKELKGLVHEGGAASWFHNTMICKGSSANMAGITCRNSRELNIINNIIISDNPGETGTGIISSGCTARIQGNNIHGWEVPMSGEAIYREIDELNLADGNHSGGIYHRNIDESPEKSFADKYSMTPHLRRNSLCINGGVDLSLHKDVALDWDRQKRPNPDDGIRPQSDIGADEYYP